MTLETTEQSSSADEPTGADRRRTPRFACNGFAEAFVIDSEFLFRGEIRDISETGCYLETRARLRLERFMSVDVCFTVKGRSYHALGRIMNVRAGKGVGIEFHFESEKERDLFNQLFFDVSHSTPPQPVPPPQVDPAAQPPQPVPAAQSSQPAQVPPA